MASNRKSQRIKCDLFSQMTPKHQLLEKPGFVSFSSIQGDGPIQSQYAVFKCHFHHIINHYVQTAERIS